MVEEILMKEQLTKEMIKAGGRLVDRLVESGLPINLALWLFTAETNRWRLMIASPLRATAGPDEIYPRIYEAVRALGPEDEEMLDDSVGLFLTNDGLAELLSREVPLAAGAKPVRLTHSGIRGRFIEDALIYRSGTQPGV